MSYRTILVHVDTTEQCAVRTRHGIDLARRFNAHLVGLAVTPRLLIPGTGHAEVVVRMLSERWEKDKALAAEAAVALAQRAQAQGISAESRHVVGEPERVICLHARYADFVVIGQAQADAEAGFAVDQVVLDAGRPVLVVPYTGAPAVIGERVLVAWSATREATRALTDALPLLAQAAQVDVLTVNAEPDHAGHGEVPGADIALYLTRHGVRANVHPTYGEDITVGEWLLSRAADLASDLIVMGAYGHSRLREMVLGGATRTMLESMTVPVLMAH